MRTMIESGRTWVVALAVGVSLLMPPGAWAQSDTMKAQSDTMKKDEMPKKGEMNDGMARDGMKKDDTMKGADKAMKKDGMMKGDAMEKKQ
jgi:pentapeptide MXKDX repeat protein